MCEYTSDANWINIQSVRTVLPGPARIRHIVGRDSSFIKEFACPLQNPICVPEEATQVQS